eukprot:CAMPEP_0171625480 /NCGR_PEP_ID=MMETSP0990-20121206/19386_1 /TAXON_ID=483369 /ORGANISM="non described non described, Strain CCMP2098" /LENGTH=127 /DNA_ID=CAMNT_0012192521 /DNA_START=681 /DNA_END=1064 /DNA_ORIENTATION=+
MRVGVTNSYLPFWCELHAMSPPPSQIVHLLHNTKYINPFQLNQSWNGISSTPKKMCFTQELHVKSLPEASTSSSEFIMLCSVRGRDDAPIPGISNSITLLPRQTENTEIIVSAQSHLKVPKVHSRPM